MHWLIAAATLAVSTSAMAQTRRALVIGIDRYSLFRPADVTAAPAADARAFVTDLNGAKNDATTMAAVLQSVYDFRAANMRVLLDAAATRAGIVAAIEKLTADSQRGDVVAFYYAGHGAQRYNSRSWKPTRLDQTIVPVDANAGVFDLRDKELAVLFGKLLDKGVTLTLIFDSCHSGSITRGTTGLARLASIDSRDSRDNSRPVPPEERGALVLSAAQDDQTAAETHDPKGKDHGEFTLALTRVMRSSPKNEPAHQIYQRVKAMVQSEGSAQEPVIKGTEANKRRPLFGTDFGELGGRITVALEKVLADTAELQGGLALGFGPGTELVQLVADKTKTPKPARLKIVEVTGMSSSKATAVSGKTPNLAPGTLFVIDKWAPPDEPVLRVWIPPAVSATELETAARSLGELKTSAAISWVDDPSAKSDDGRSLFLVYPTKAGWVARSPLGTTKAIASPTAAAVTAAVSSLAAELAQRAARDAAAARATASAAPLPPHVFVVLPPTSQVRSAIHLGTGTANSAIDLADSPEGADYLLAGRLSPNGVLYAWLRPHATPATSTRSSLPSRSNWFPAAQAVDSLEDRAILLGRINGWLTLDSPPQAGAFPYTLTIRNAESGETKTSGETYGGERYDLVLRRDTAPQAVPMRRWIYVFAIDSDGTGTPLYPQSGTVENRVPFDSAGIKQEMPMEIKLPRTRSIPIVAPYGVDTWFLVTSDEPIDVETFRFAGVRSTTRGGGQSALASLLRRVGGATRAAGGDPPPTNWSVQKIKLVSKPKAAAMK